MPDRMVIKIGTGVLVGRNGLLDHAVITHLVDQVSTLYREGMEIVLVSSGAVGAGSELIALSPKLETRLRKKMLAAVGQARLMQLYREGFDRSKIPIAQLLLLRQDLHDRERYLNIRTILESLIAQRIIPILNENDPLAAGDLCFSDNDNLAALTAMAVKANHLIILSDIEGLYTDNPAKNPSARFLSVVKEITPEIKSYCSESISGLGIGGMINKIMAIEMVTRAGIPTHLVYGRKPNAILDCLNGKNPGTYFMAQPKRSSTAYLGQKSWLAGGVVPSGALVVDPGALIALKKHKSLLAVGILRIMGSFHPGDVVSIFDENNVPHGTGKVRYGSQRLKKLEAAFGRRAQVAKELFLKPVIHVDEMVVW